MLPVVLIEKGLSVAGLTPPSADPRRDKGGEIELTGLARCLSVAEPKRTIGWSTLRRNIESTNRQASLRDAQLVRSRLDKLFVGFPKLASSV